MKKFLIVFSITLILGAILFWKVYPLPQPRINSNNQTHNVTKYQTQEECERKTEKTCVIAMCDVVPEGKTIEEVCGPGPTRWWAPLVNK